jgi:hypothetical protein
MADLITVFFFPLLHSLPNFSLHSLSCFCITQFTVVNFTVIVFSFMGDLPGCSCSLRRDMDFPLLPSKASQYTYYVLYWLFLTPCDKILFRVLFFVPLNDILCSIFLVNYFNVRLHYNVYNSFSCHLY